MAERVGGSLNDVDDSVTAAVGGGQDGDVVGDGGDQGAAGSVGEALPPFLQFAFHGGELGQARLCSVRARWR
jgi:hypothetical protein